MMHTTRPQARPTATITEKVVAMNFTDAHMQALGMWEAEKPLDAVGLVSVTEAISLPADWRIRRISGRKTLVTDFIITLTYTVR